MLNKMNKTFGTPSATKYFLVYLILQRFNKIKIWTAKRP